MKFHLSKLSPELQSEVLHRIFSPLALPTNFDILSALKERAKIQLLQSKLELRIQNGIIDLSELIKLYTPKVDHIWAQVKYIGLIEYLASNEEFKKHLITEYKEDRDIIKHKTNLPTAGPDSSAGSANLGSLDKASIIEELMRLMLTKEAQIGGEAGKIFIAVRQLPSNFYIEFGKTTDLTHWNKILGNDAYKSFQNYLKENFAPYYGKNLIAQDLAKEAAASSQEHLTDENTTLDLVIECTKHDGRIETLLKWHIYIFHTLCKYAIAEKMLQNPQFRSEICNLIDHNFQGVKDVLGIFKILGKSPIINEVILGIFNGYEGAINAVLLDPGKKYSIEQGYIELLGPNSHLNIEYDVNPSSVVIRHIGISGYDVDTLMQAVNIGESVSKHPGDRIATIHQEDEGCVDNLETLKKNARDELNSAGCISNATMGLLMKHGIQGEFLAPPQTDDPDLLAALALSLEDIGTTTAPQTRASALETQMREAGKNKDPYSIAGLQASLLHADATKQGKTVSSDAINIPKELTGQERLIFIAQVQQEKQQNGYISDNTWQKVVALGLIPEFRDEIIDEEDPSDDEYMGPSDDEDDGSESDALGKDSGDFD
ncbi:MAG UNVERIFIED_CONTAM: hypothetical protein LVQ98_07340 [Rickettsiaceae bacterium]|jgi:hypothetical protein